MILKPSRRELIKYAVGTGAFSLVAKGQLIPFPGPQSNHGSAPPPSPHIVSSTAHATAAATATTTGMNTTGATLLTVVTVCFNSNPVGSGVITDLVGINSNTWSVIGAYADSSGTNCEITIFYCAPTHVGAGHIVNMAGLQYTAIVFSAWNTTSALDVQNGGGSTGSVTSLLVPGVTPTQANDLIICGFGANGTFTGALGVDSGLTIPANGSVANGDGAITSLNAAVGYILETSIVAKSPTWSDTGNSTTCAGAIGAFK